MQHSFFQRGRQLFQRRSFFLRLLVMLMSILFIPLLILSVYYVNEKTEALVQKEEEQLQIVTQAVVSQIEGYIDAIRATDMSIKGDPHFISSFHAASIRNEMELIDSLERLKVTLPFVTEYGFYLAENDCLYLTSGKYRADIFAQKVLEISRETLLTLFTEQRKAHFVSLYPQKKSFCMIIPAAADAQGVIPIVGYYQIDGSTLVGALKSVLPSPYRLYRLEYENGVLLYQVSQPMTEENYLIHSLTSSSRIHVTVCAPRSQMSNIIDQLSSFFRMVSLLCIGMLTVGMAAAAFVGYQPVWKAFHKVRSTASLPYDGQNEIDYILEAFDDSVNERRRIEEHLREEHQLLMERTLESLLLGKPITQAEQAMIPLASVSSFCVVCAQTLALPAEKLHLWDQSAIRALEIYTDGVTALLCPLHGDELFAREETLCWIRAHTQSDLLPLGISSIFHSADELAQAYGEAVQALRTPQVAMNRFYENLPVEAEAVEEECAPAQALSEVQKKLIQYTDEHFRNADFGVTAVAGHLEISEYMAGKLLRETYGANYSRLINERRVEYAKELLLSTDESIATVAELSGLRSSSYFIRIFRSSEGITPSAWRQYMREQ